jgi:hypothetical protein
MASDSDDLEKALQQNLQIRRELGAEVGKVDGIRPAKQDRGMVYRLGWVLYWACLALIGAWVLFFVNVTFWGGEKWGSAYDTILMFVLPIIILYGLGRAFRYVLSGE